MFAASIWIDGQPYEFTDTEFIENLGLLPCNRSGPAVAEMACFSLSEWCGDREEGRRASLVPDGNHSV